MTSVYSHVDGIVAKLLSSSSKHTPENAEKLKQGTDAYLELGKYQTFLQICSLKITSSCFQYFKSLFKHVQNVPRQRPVHDFEP